MGNKSQLTRIPDTVFSMDFRHTSRKKRLKLMKTHLCRIDNRIAFARALTRWAQQKTVGHQEVLMKIVNIKSAPNGCRLIAPSLITLGLVLAPALVLAQAATIYGSLGNFDVVNNTGQDAFGFEAEVEGLPHGYPVVTFPSQRDGAPVLADYTTTRRRDWTACHP
jgi:hypothetical protein